MQDAFFGEMRRCVSWEMQDEFGGRYRARFPKDLSAIDRACIKQADTVVQSSCPSSASTRLGCRRRCRWDTDHTSLRHLEGCTARPDTAGSCSPPRSRTFHSNTSGGSITRSANVHCWYCLRRRQIKAQLHQTEKVSAFTFGSTNSATLCQSVAARNPSVRV